MEITKRIVLPLLGILLAEATLHLATAIFPNIEARLSGLKPRYVSDPVLSVRGDSSLPEYDDRGFRNAVRPVEASVVAIGDSQTEGSGVARVNAWPQQVAAHSGKSVYQLAFGGYGPGQYLALIDEALSLHPRSIVVALYTGNDLAGAYDWVYVKGRNPELKTSTPSRQAELERTERDRGPIAQAWRTTRLAQKGLHRRPMLGWLRETIESRCKLVALYQQLRWQLQRRGSDLDADSEHPGWPTTLRAIEGVRTDLLFPFDDGGVRTVFTPEARLAAQDLDDPRIDEGLRLTLSLLERIADRCRERTRLMVLLMPTKELVFADRVLRHAAHPPATFTRLVEQEMEVRARVSAELHGRGIEIIDPLPEMRSLLSPPDPAIAITNPYPETWDGHPAAAGHAAVSRTVAAAISRPPA